MVYCRSLLFRQVLKMFDFSHYYDVGDYLINIPSEANIRSGISRYYYSGLCCVRRYLVETMNETEFINGFNIHKRICDRLINSCDDTEASIGEKLIQLKELRNNADYDWILGFDYFNENLNNVQRDSKIILEQIEALRNSPPLEL